MPNTFLEIFQIPWVYWSWITISVITTMAVITVVVMDNRNPIKSLAWVTVLVLLPVVGIILYVFFGRSIKNKRMLSRGNRRRLRKSIAATYQPPEHVISSLAPELRQEVNLGQTLIGAKYYPDNSVKIYTSGRQKFDDLLRDLADARSYINIQYYIFEADEIGRAIRDILVERARAGVKVRVIYDHVGSWNVRSSFFKQMRREGIEVYPFFRVTFPVFGTRINWRNHRKLCIIDGDIGYIGGMNIADRYIDGGRDFSSWRDTHIRITGPAVLALQVSFTVDWTFMGQPLIEDSIPAFDTPADAEPDAVSDVGMQFITSGPASQWNNVAFSFLKAIGSARKRIFIQTPYFLPTEALLRALQTAALAGVDVRVMLPRKSDSWMLRYASFSYIAECMQAGIKFYLYDAGMLHSKTLIVDNELASVGSTNFDFRSFEHNFEGNMFMYSKEFNARMIEIFSADMRQCTRVRPKQWHSRPLRLKALESIIRLLSPVL